VRELLLVVMLVIHPLWVRGSVTEAVTPSNTFIQDQEKEQGHQYPTEDGETPQDRGNKGGEGTCSDESSCSSGGSSSSSSKQAGRLWIFLRVFLDLLVSLSRFLLPWVV
jgi:hypothetical protein